GSNFRDLHEYLAQFFGGADDFLEHRRALYFFPQRDVFVSRPVFGAFAIIDVSSGRVPANEASLFVVERIVTDEKPTILTILPQRSLFNFKREAACKGRPPLIPQPLDILRMKDPRAKVRGDYILHAETGIVEDCLVGV